MHPTTLLAHSGLAPLPAPTRRRPAPAAPRRRPLRAPRSAVVGRVAARRPALPSGLRAACSGWRPAALAVVLTLVVGGLGVLRVWPPFAVVMSGSMAPTINTGDMVVLERLHAPARVGQIVAVDVPDAARARYGYPPVVIHRVFTITPDGQIRTKGDARPQPDPFTVPRTAVDTRVIGRIPSGGRVLAFVQSAPGLLWLAFGGLLFFGLPLVDRQRDARRREAEATAALRDQLAAVTDELGRLHADQDRNRATADATLAQLDRLARLVELTSATPAADDAARHAQPPPVRAVTHCAAPASSAPAAIVAAAPGPIAVLGAGEAEDAEIPGPGPSSSSAARGPSVLFVLPPREVRRVPPPSGRWDAPPPPAPAGGTGWAAAPAALATGRFSRAGRLVAASQA